MTYFTKFSLIAEPISLRLELPVSRLLLTRPYVAGNATKLNIVAQMPLLRAIEEINPGSTDIKPEMVVNSLKLLIRDQNAAKLNALPIPLSKDASAVSAKSGIINIQFLIENLIALSRYFMLHLHFFLYTPTYIFLYIPIPILYKKKNSSVITKYY